MPPLPANIIERQRVLTALEEALATHSLVVLTAPMGHGKTTLAQQLLGQWEGRSLYLRLKPGWRDNAEYLWSDICARLEDQGMFNAPALKLIGFPSDNARMYRCLPVLREYLAAMPTLLILDDFHHAEGTALDRFTESMVYEEIPGFTLLLLGRTKPGLPLASMAMKGYALELDPGLLDFSRDEARELFEAAGEHDVEFADSASEFSQGWAAVLRICLQSHLADNTVKPVRDIEQFLAETFLATYSEEDQRLLLQLSVLDAFSPEQAVFLTGQQSVPARLKRLYEQNAFLQYSSISGMYAIHALLRSFLLQSLSDGSMPAREGIDIRLLYRRAAECGMESGNYLQAMRFFAQAGTDDDLLQILRIFEVPGEGFFMLAAPETVREIIESIPWEVRFLSPVGYLGFVHRHAVRVSRREAAAMMGEAETRFLAEGAFPEDMQRKIRGELELVRAICSFNDINAICTCYEQADFLLQGRSSLVSKVMFWAYNCAHSAFLYLKEPGGFERLEMLASEKLVHFRNVSGGANAGAEELLAAERLFETGKLQNTELLQTALYKAQEGEQYSAIVAASFGLARRQLATGRTEGVYDLLEPLRKPMEKEPNPLLLHNLEVCLGYLASVCNDVDRIPAWLLQQAPLTVRNNQAHSFTLIVRGKAIMALKNWPRLLAYAEQIEPEIASMGILFGRIHVLLLKAVATDNMQKRNTSLSDKYLMQALDLARPDGIITSIAEYGANLLPLLQRMSNLNPERRALGALRQMTKKYAALGRKRGSKLTLHEMEVMKMVRAGSNNKDIAAKTGITQGGVANSLSRIYLKLGVGSRIEAINKWNEEASSDVEGLDGD